MCVGMGVCVWGGGGLVLLISFVNDLYEDGSKNRLKKWINRYRSILNIVGALMEPR